MKKTRCLKVSISSTIDRVHLVMHPNEGFDLGFMRVAHPVQLCRNLNLEDYLKGGEGEVEEVSLDLLNECPPQTIQVGIPLFLLLGKPIQAVVLYDGHRLFVHPQKG